MKTICLRGNGVELLFATQGLGRILLVFLGLVWSCWTQAEGVVTNCTEANLRAALAGGGTVTFACDGTITLGSEIVITSNTAIDGTGRAVSLSGNNSTRLFAVTNNARLDLINLTLRDGRAPFGGAIYNRGGEVHLFDCTFEANSAVAEQSQYAEGGAIRNATILRATNCTFSGNSVAGGGGAINNEEGDAVLVNCTFYRNVATMGPGGGILAGYGSLIAVNCTLSGNAAMGSVVGFGSGGGVYAKDFVTFINCILAKSVSGGNAFVENLFASEFDGGNNISDDNSFVFWQPTSRTNTDPGIGGLADNGGPTKTIALLAGSPAINAGNDWACPATDQRGVLRPIEFACDIGAYEGSIPVPNFSQNLVPASIFAGELSRLQFTLQNTNAVSYSGLAFTNDLPAEIRIAAVPSVSNSCGSGLVVAPAGGATVAFSGGDLSSHQTCTISVAVTGSTYGIWTNPAVAFWSAETALGNSNEPVTISIGGKPLVAAQSVSQLTSNSVRLTAVINPGGSETTVFFRYGTTTNLGDAVLPQAVGNGYFESTSATDITGLSPDTSYYYRTIATNAHGSSFGAIQSFITVGGPIVSSCEPSVLLSALNVSNAVRFACDGTIVLTNTLTIDRDTTLDGTGQKVVLSGGNAVRVFNVNPGIRLTLMNLTIANGSHLGTNGAPPESAFGGAIYNNGGTVDLLYCTLINNSARGGDARYGFAAGPARGGAVFNEGGTLNITNSLLSGNSTVGGTATPWAIGPYAYPAGDAFGGAICDSTGRVNLAGTVFSFNTATGGVPGIGIFYFGPGSSFGGAVHSTGGELVVTNCAFLANRAFGGSSPLDCCINGAGGLGSGGAFSLSNGLLVCAGTAFITNQADGGAATRYSGSGDGLGGAIFNAGSVAFRDCTLSNNVATGGFGGIENGVGLGGGIYSIGILELSGSTLAGNVAFGPRSFGTAHGGLSGSGYGGGILNVGILTVTNSTMFSNRAEGGAGSGFSVGAGDGSGGGLFNTTGMVQIVNSTLSANNAYNGGGTPGTLLPGRGGGVFSTNGTVTLWNSIVANSPSGSNCFGTIVDGGHNLSSDGSCHFSAPGSLNNTDPRLSDLGDYGGPTPTLALLDGSPALDAADAAFCPATDQRGFARPYGSGCDIGAFEWWPLLSIRGTITGWGVAGVRVSAGAASTSANAAGEYILPALVPGTYTVRPGGESCVFLPSIQAVTLGPDATNVNFLSYRSNAFTIEAMEGKSRFIFAGVPEQSYQLLVSSNGSGWEPVMAVDTDTNGFFFFDATNGVGGGMRLFEALKP